MTDMALLYATLESASASAWRVLKVLLPGSEVYVAEVTVDGCRRGYCVVAGVVWPDRAWEKRAQAALIKHEGQQVDCVVRLVLRKPVVSPPEVARHVFIVGCLPRPSVTPH